MPQRPFRFLHAADLRLDRPVSGVSDAPDELVDLLIDCPLKAAERVFDAAINQRASFVVLAGNVIDAQLAAPREWLFLAEQFERLAKHNIAVYWAGGSIDSVNHWHDFVQWPANVRYFPPGRVERYRFEIAGMGVCEIIGASQHDSAGPNPYDFSPQMSGVFSVAVANASWNSSGLHEIGVNYWALGGVHNRGTPLDAGSMAHFPGTTQARSVMETGPHGCTIVSVDEHSRIQLTPVDCDLVRWHWPRVPVADSISSAPLTDALFQRAEQLLIEQPNVAHLVSWQIECGPALRTAVRRGELTSKLLNSLRSQLGHRSPPCWTVSIDAALPQEIPTSWREEDTIRGDFLRELHTPAVDAEGRAIEGVCLSGASSWDAPLTPTEVRQIQRDVAWLGADLLSPQEAAS
jgi:DNA repair exonuclease SbcCD nuclease subunit